MKTERIVSGHTLWAAAIALLVWVVVSSLAPQDAHGVQVQPTPVWPERVRLAVIGDFGDGSQTAADVAALVKSWQPDAVVTTGDNNYPIGLAQTLDAHVGRFYQEFIGSYNGAYGSGSPVNRFFPVLGNHDWGTRVGSPPVPQPYLDYFTLPDGPGHERYYDIVLGPVHLFALDSDPHEPDGTSVTSVQAAWLRERLASSTAAWKLVVLHHPPYSSGWHGSNPRLRWPFQKWGATAVLSGHDHTYERILVNGFPYFVNGLGGSSRYWFTVPVKGSQVRYNGDSGAMLIEASTQRITFRFITRRGIEIDRFILSAAPARSQGRAGSGSARHHRPRVLHSWWCLIE